MIPSREYPSRGLDSSAKTDAQGEAIQEGSCKGKQDARGELCEIAGD